MLKMVSPCQIWSNPCVLLVLRSPIWLRSARKQSTVPMIQYCAKICPALWSGWRNPPDCWKRPVPDWKPILVRLQLENYLSKAVEEFYRYLVAFTSSVCKYRVSHIVGNFSPFTMLWRIWSEENNPGVSSGIGLFGSGRSHRNSRRTSSVPERFKSLFK